VPGAVDGPEYDRSSAPPGTWTVAQLYDRLRGVLEVGVPTPLWVTGEVAKAVERDGRLDLELVDPGASTRSRPLLSCVVWSKEWSRLRSRLENAQLTLVHGMRLSVCGQVRLWPAASRVQFAVSDINVEELLGALALRRQALVRDLKATGLYDANRRLPPPDLPLRIGVVGGRGTQGTRDFVEKLSASPFAFELLTAEATFEGGGAERSISAALRALAAAHRRGAVSLDLIVVVRGGGARAALAPFDSEPVVRAVVTSPVPVWTGIGHDADCTLADDVAQRAWRTPTECAEAVVSTVTERWCATANAVGKVAQAVGRLRADARRHLEETERRASIGVRRAVERERLRLDHGLERIGQAARVVRDREQTGLADRLARSERAARRAVGDARRHLEETERRASIGVRRAVERERLRLDHGLERIGQAARVVRDREQTGLADRLARSERAARRVVAGAAVALDARERTLSALDPAGTLRRGYAIVRDRGGRAVRDPGALQPRDPLSIQVAHGSFRAQVTGGEAEPSRSGGRPGVDTSATSSRIGRAEARTRPELTLFDVALVESLPANSVDPTRSDKDGRHSGPELSAGLDLSGPASRPTGELGHDVHRVGTPGVGSGEPVPTANGCGAAETGDMGDGDGGADGD